jgi:hypothetical protein
MTGLLLKKLYHGGLPFVSSTSATARLIKRKAAILLAALVEQV